VNAVLQFLQRWRAQTTTGCDFGGATVKLVTLKRVKDRYAVLGRGLVEVDWKGDEEVALQIVRNFFREQAAAKRIAINLVDPRLQVRRMDFPKMPERDLKMAIRWNLRDAIEGPLDKLQVAFTDIGPSGGERRTLMAYGVDGSIVQRRQDLAKKLGVRLVAIEPNVSALLAAFTLNIDTKDRCVAIVDLGYEYGHFMVVEQGVLVFVRYLSDLNLAQLASAMKPLAAAASEHWSVLHYLAEAGDNLNDAEREVLQSFHTQWLIEVQRSLDTYVSNRKAGASEVSQLYLCGGGAMLHSLPAVAAKNLGIETLVLNPFEQLVQEDGAPVVAGTDAPLFAVAVGLAIPQK